ncbi:Fc receptor-like protein 5 [Pagrus major]|uniref:Fc receptor-like protein 5 n=1 Tax=Pagrus major TaxID=143350 RepID=UPI003CC8B5F8
MTATFFKDGSPIEMDRTHWSSRTGEMKIRVSVSDVGWYKCKFDDGTESAERELRVKVSNRATLTLQPIWTPHSWIFSGETITLRCEIQKGRDNKWTYEWTKDNLNTPPTSNEYRIISATEAHNGEHRCKGRRDSYSSTEWSDAITLTVSSNRPKAELRADDRDIPVGGSVTLTCSVNPSSSGWKYFWYRGEKTSEPLTTQLSAGRRSVSHGGVYWCRGGRGEPVYYTEYSDPITINKNVHNKAVVTLRPNWSEIYRGERITLRCEIQGGGDNKWTYEWTKDNLNTPPTSNEYRIISATEAHSGEHRCKGRRDSYSSTEWSDAIKLTVSSNRPKAELRADDRDIPVGGSVTLTCSVNPSAGWKHFWYRGEKTSEPLTTQLSAGRRSVSHGGVYWCRGGRGEPVYYTEYSDPITINKNVHNKAVVTLQPNWSEIYRGERITLRCEIQRGRDNKWTYEWTKDNLNTPPTSNEYRIISATNAHSGEYRCKGRRDSYSSTWWSDAIKLTVSSNRPKAELRADDRDIPVGGSVTLTCSVNPSAGWKYFWYRGEKTSEPLTTQLSAGRRSVSEEGVYWCRGGRGEPVYYTEYSDSITISKNDGDMILLSPARPVTEGESCQSQMKDSTSVNTQDKSQHRAGCQFRIHALSDQSSLRAPTQIVWTTRMIITLLFSMVIFVSMKQSEAVKKLNMVMFVSMTQSEAVKKLNMVNKKICIN